MREGSGLTKTLSYKTLTILYKTHFKLLIGIH